MTLDNDISVLQSVPLFADFGGEHLRLIAFGSQKLAFPASMELFHNGQESDGVYIVLSGVIDLVTYYSDQVSVLGTFQRGGLIGELALIIPNQRVGTALVRENAEVLKVPRNLMLRVLNEYPHLAARLHDRMLRSVNEFSGELQKAAEHFDKLEYGS